MPSIEKRTRDASITWLARWRDPQGQQRKQSFSRKIDAERHLTSVRAALLSGTYVDASAGRITVEEWSARWLEAQVALKPSTRAGYVGVLRRYVLPKWGALQLAQVQHAAVAAWVAELSARGLAPSTIRHAHRVLSMILSLAVRDGRLVRNVADRVQLPRARRAEARFLSHDEVAALADAAPAPFDVMIRLLAFTGLRFGEVAGLRIGRVDLMRRRLDVAEAISEVDGKLISGEPKSHQRRTVPFPRSLVEPLTLVVAGRDADELVFPAKGGAALRNANFRRRVFDPAVRAAGLSNLTPHDLRDTAASLAVSAGANVKAVQRMLGHASAAMTLDVYSGLFGDDLDAVADRLDAAAAASAQARVPPVGPAGSVADLAERRASR